MVTIVERNLYKLRSAMQKAAEVMHANPNGNLVIRDYNAARFAYERYKAQVGA